MAIGLASITKAAAQSKFCKGVFAVLSLDNKGSDTAQESGDGKFSSRSIISPLILPH